MVRVNLAGQTAHRGTLNLGMSVENFLLDLNLTMVDTNHGGQGPESHMVLGWGNGWHDIPNDFPGHYICQYQGDENLSIQYLNI